MGEQTIIRGASRDQNVKKAHLPGVRRVGWLAFPESVHALQPVGCLGKETAQWEV